MAGVMVVMGAEGLGEADSVVQGLSGRHLCESAMNTM